MLSRRAAERDQRIARHVVPAFDGDLLDRLGHVLDRDGQEPFGDLFRRCRLAGRIRNLARKDCELLAHDFRIQWLITAWPEHARKELRLQPPQHHIAVRHRERTAAPVARGPRNRAGRFRPDAQAHAVEAADRAAARSHRADVQHRHAQAHARDRDLVAALVHPGIMRNVGRGAAHVEADHATEARRARHARHADDAARGPRQNRILAAERRRIGQPARGLHEEQSRLIGKRFLHAPDMALQHRRQIRVGHTGIAAADHLDQRAHLVTDGDLRKTDRACDLRDALLVRRITIRMHQHDRKRAVALGEGRFQLRARFHLVECSYDLALGGDAFADLDDAAVQQLRREQFGPVLGADAKRVLVPRRNREHGRLACAFEQRIGRNRRPHLDGGNGRRAMPRHQRFDPCRRRVAIMFRIFRQQLQRRQRSIRPPSDDVGERAAPVDPELPSSRRRNHEKYPDMTTALWQQFKRLRQTWTDTYRTEVAAIRREYTIDLPSLGDGGDQAVHQSEIEILEFRIKFEGADEIGGKGEFVLVARCRVEDFGDQPAHRLPFASQEIVHFSEHHTRHDHEARQAENGLIIRKARTAVRGACERSKEPARIDDDRTVQPSRSRNSSDSSPSFASVDSKSRVEGGRRPV